MDTDFKLELFICKLICCLNNLISREYPAKPQNMKQDFDLSIYPRKKCFTEESLIQSIKWLA